MGEFLSPKLRKISTGVFHYCEGCEDIHYIAIEEPLANGAHWSFDGKVDSPTFTPSVKIRTAGDGFERRQPDCCHYNITSGEVIFHGDTTHKLKGKKVPLPDFPPKYFEE